MRILLDVDGVLADFVGSFLRMINRRRLAFSAIHKPPFTRSDVTDYEIFDCLAKKGLETPELYKAICWARARQDGFCIDLEPLDGAVEAVTALRAIPSIEIYAVTTPLDSHYWHWEREQWLQQHFEIDRQHTIFAHNKSLIRGDVFIDDQMENVMDWQAANPKAYAVPWDRTLEPSKMIAAWQHFVERIIYMHHNYGL